MLIIGALVQRNKNDAYRIKKKYCSSEEAELAEGHLCSCVRIRKFSHGLKEMLTAGPCPYLVRTKAMYSIRGSVSRNSAGETMREQPSGLKNGLRRRKCLALTSTRPLGLIFFFSCFTFLTLSQTSQEKDPLRQARVVSAYLGFPCTMSTEVHWARLAGSKLVPQATNEARCIGNAERMPSLSSCVIQMGRVNETNETRCNQPSLN